MNDKNHKIISVGKEKDLTNFNSFIIKKTLNKWGREEM